MSEHPPPRVFEVVRREARPASAMPQPRFSFEGLPPRTASLGARAVAYLIDFILLWVVLVALTVGVAVLRLLQPGQAGTREVAQTLLPVVLLAIPLFLLYFTLLEGLWGRTVGKAAMGLRVLRLDGQRARMFDSFVRNLVRLLWGPALPSIVLLVTGNLWLLLQGQAPIVDALALVAGAFLAVDLWLLHSTEMEQRLGDVAAGTVVVTELAAPAA